MGKTLIKKMNKILTVISLLFIVSYANCTKKVSYSEIVSSLAQVTHVDGADSIIDTVAANWAESLKKLQLFNVALTNQCNGIMKRSSDKAAAFADRIKSNAESIGELQADNIKLSEEIKEAVDAQAGNRENAEKLREELKTDAGVLQDKSMAIVERARVLRRLMNLVQDELTGNQRNSTVGDFNVDKKLSGFSFVEVHNQLKELESHDPIVRSMITTLVLITQDQKNIFANQAQVGKIAAMIEEIIKKDAAAGLSLRQQTADKANEINKTLGELADDMEKQMNVLAEKRASVVQNHQTIAFVKSESTGIEANMKRVAERKVSNMAMCKKVQDLNKLQRGDFSAGRQRFADLKKLVQ